MPIDPNRAKELFLAVLEMPAHERGAYLDSACGGDSALRRRIEAMLQSQEASGELLPCSPAQMLANDDATQANATAAFPHVSETPPTLTQPAMADQLELPYLMPSTRPGALGRLGHYEVLEVIGKGGFGTVLKAFDAKLHRVIAVKVLAPEMAASGAARKRFVREAQAAAAIKNDHVVAIYNVEDEHQPPYLVMELIDGISLQDRLDQEGPLELKEILRIGTQVAEGLGAAHKQGLVHRDIKPANILLENGVQRVRITDFGLAKVADDASITQSGVIAGTPMYMSPEQAEGLPFDHRSDLFSLGTVLYAMCTGRPPFRASGTMAVLKRVIEETPRPIREINPEIPDWLESTIAKLHAKKPEERFQTARALADVLSEKLAELQSHGRVQQVVGAPTKATPAQALRSHMSDGVHASSKRPLAVATGLFLLISLILAAIVYMNRNSGTSPDPEKKKINGGDGWVQTPTANPPLAVAPFDAAKAKEHQDTWAKHLGVDLEITNSIGMRLRLIPPGEYMMGSSPEEIAWLLKEAPDLKDAPDHIKDNVRSEGPQRRVIIKEPFYMGAHEVTVGHFREFVRATKHRTEAETGQGGVTWNDDLKKWERKPENVWDNAEFAGGDDHPVVFVTLADARAFCAWLTEQEGRAYAVPAEEQWEWACRAGTTTHWFFGNDDTLMKDFGWTTPFKRMLRPVGRLAPNPFGLYDIHGNVQELTISLQEQTIARGGQAGESAQRARSASRAGVGKQYDPAVSRGFRVVIVGDLKAKTSSTEWVPLFNGMDQPGWTDKPDKWKVDNGAIIGHGSSYLWLTGQKFENFHCRLEAKINADGWGGLTFRNTGESHGNVAICPKRGKTGSLFFFNKGKNQLLDQPENQLAAPDTWLNLELIVQGKNVVVLVNGTKTAEATIEGLPDRGPILLNADAPGTVIHFRKIEIKELPPTKTATAPFVLLAKDVKAERKFATLGATVAAAQAGDTIEIRGDGPFVCEPIKLQNKELRIKATEGFRPVIKLKSAEVKPEAALFATNARLILEGLILELESPEIVPETSPFPRIVFSLKAPVHVANCRFSSSQSPCVAIMAAESPICEVRNCHFFGDKIHCCVEWNLGNGENGLVIIDNSLLAGGFHGLVVNQGENSQLGGAISIQRTTLAVANPINFAFYAEAPGAWAKASFTGKPLRMEVKESILAGPIDCILGFSQVFKKAEPAGPLEADKALSRLLSWQEQRNLFPKGVVFLNTGSNLQPKGQPFALKTPADWQRFWKLANPGFLEGTALFQGGDVPGKIPPSPGQLSAAGFRLVKGSPGQGVLPGGKDLGADVDLVGPGVAYERWRKTPKYEAWRKGIETVLPAK